MHKVRGHYSSCTCRSSENICSSSGGAHENGNTGQNRMKLSLAQKWCISEFDGLRPLKANVLFCRFFFKSHLFLEQIQCSGVVFS